MEDKDKVLRLVHLLLADGGDADSGALDVEIQAALLIAEEHVAAPLPDDSKATEHAPAVLLAALAVSASSELTKGKK